MTDDAPAELEALVGRAGEGHESMVNAIQAVLESVLVVPSAGDVTTGSAAFVPVLVPVDGVQHVAVFTSAEGVAAVSHLAPFAMTVPGRSFVAGLNDEYGLLVTGRLGGFAIPPKLLAAIRAER